MITAASAIDTTIFAAFAVGVVSFISPCVLPLVPGYLSAVSGLTIEELERGERRARVLGPALVFCLAFSLMFIALGMTATGLGQTLQRHQQLLYHVAGVIIIALGIYVIAALFVLRLNRDVRPQALIRRAGSGGPIIAGLAFAIAWTPCVGPTLASILAAASTSDSVGHGGLLLAFYSAGLAIPFLISAVAFERATTAFGWLRRHHAAITVVSGTILIAMGVLMLTGELFELNSAAQRMLEGSFLDRLSRW